MVQSFDASDLNIKQLYIITNIPGHLSQVGLSINFSSRNQDKPTFDSPFFFWLREQHNHSERLSFKTIKNINIYYYMHNIKLLEEKF